MTKGLKREVSLVVLMVALIGLSWVMVFSTASVLMSDQHAMGVFYHLVRQMLATGVGVLALITVAGVPLSTLLRFSTRALAVTSVLMLFVFIPGLGKQVMGAMRWINLRFITVQPVEVFKLTSVICYAAWLSAERPGEAWPVKTWGKLGGLLGAGLILPLLQRDIGSAILLMGIGLTMIWLGGARFRWIAGFAALALGAAVFAIWLEPYRVLRIKQFLSNWAGGEGGYQTRQSLIALGSGGVIGVGLGEGSQKLFYLFSAHADFIFAIIGEELGLLGSLTVLAVFGLMWREGVAIARGCVDPFPRLLASGLILLIFAQALWHISVALVLVPTKGLPLPFVSYGGSSLVASMMAVGLILRCAQEPIMVRNRSVAGRGLWLS